MAAVATASPPATDNSVKSQDHAYIHDPLRPAGQVNTHIPTPGPATLPPTLTFSPPSNAQAPASSSSPPVTSSQPLPTPPPVTPPASSSLGPNMGFFARRGSLMPKQGDAQSSSSSTFRPPPHLNLNHGRGRAEGEGIEMSPVKTVVIDANKLKEEQAMAKWRKWVIDQPSPPASARSSPIRNKAHTAINMTPPLSPAQTQHSIRREASVSPTLLPRSVSLPDSQGLNSARPSATLKPTSDKESHIYNTESVMALRDVELAVDEDVLRSMGDGSRSRLNSRRMSVIPPPFPESNPFEDIGPRLTSRRVRPLVLELVQALGHFIDAVWYLAHPDLPCPWAEPTDPVASSSNAGPSSAPMLGNRTESQSQWKSKMVTAVRDGRRDGFVDDPPTAKDAEFWESEVRHALKDVDHVVGIYKGVAWAFDTAMNEGRYGEVHPKNVTTTGEHGGGLTRLLHDLEEALWGNAAPRSTDLAYELPIDFDPYAIVVDEPVSQGTQGRGISPGKQREDPLDAAGERKASEAGANSANDETASAAAGAQRRVIKVNAWDSALNLDAFKKEGEEEVSLEELGRRRHQEWLQSRKGDGWAT